MATKTKRPCPNCGKHMKQQFIDLRHCKCGTSWIKSMGYFQLEQNMVFALERRKNGNKTRQVAVIRYK